MTISTKLKPLAVSYAIVAAVGCGSKGTISPKVPSQQRAVNEINTGLYPSGSQVDPTITGAKTGAGLSQGTIVLTKVTSLENRNKGKASPSYRDWFLNKSGKDSIKYQIFILIFLRDAYSLNKSQGSGEDYNSKNGGLANEELAKQYSDELPKKSLFFSIYKDPLPLISPRKIVRFLLGDNRKKGYDVRLWSYIREDDEFHRGLYKGTPELRDLIDLTRTTVVKEKERSIYMASVMLGAIIDYMKINSKKGQGWNLIKAYHERRLSPSFKSFVTALAFVIKDENLVQHVTDSFDEEMKKKRGDTNTATTSLIGTPYDGGKVIAIPGINRKSERKGQPYTFKDLFLDLTKKEKNQYNEELKKERLAAAAHAARVRRNNQHR